MADKDRDWYWESLQSQSQKNPEPPPTPRLGGLAVWLRRLLLALLVLGLLAGSAWYALRDAERNLWAQQQWYRLQVLLGRADEVARQKAADQASGRYSDSVRPLSACIKPGNVIDNEVRACMQGYHQKTW